MPSTHTRRRLLAAASSVGLAALAGCSGGSDDPADENESGGDPADGDEGPDDGTDGSDGTDADSPPKPVDWTGEERGTVSVGRGGPVFDPDSVRVRPGTTVRWLWEDGGHTVTPVDQPVGADWAGEEQPRDEGYAHEFAFETAGTYEYVCDPHRDRGMRGYVIVTDD